MAMLWSTSVPGCTDWLKTPSRLWSFWLFSRCSDTISLTELSPVKFVINVFMMVNDSMLCNGEKGKDFVTGLECAN